MRHGSPDIKMKIDLLLEVTNGKGEYCELLLKVKIKYDSFYTCMSLTSTVWQALNQIITYRHDTL